MGAKKGEKQTRPNYEEATAERKKNFLKAFKKTMGVVAPACEKAGISRRTFYVWMDNDPEFKEDVKHVRESALDFAESKLLENINKNKETSIIFYLKTQGKSRGYVERVEQETVEKDDFTDYTDEELKEAIKKAKSKL